MTFLRPDRHLDQDQRFWGRWATPREPTPGSALGKPVGAVAVCSMHFEAPEKPRGRNNFFSLRYRCFLCAQ